MIPGNGFSAGASYKTKQSFGDFKLDNTYLDSSTGENEFKIDYPAIWSLGLGFSPGQFDLALITGMFNMIRLPVFPL